MFGLDDLDAFTADMGTPCVADNGAAFTALLDQPDQLLDLQRVAVHTREYEITYRTSAVTLARGQTVSVAGVSHTVREAPRQLDDGAFSVALLTKTN